MYDYVDLWSVSPKFGTSGREEKLNWHAIDTFKKWGPKHVQWKFVVDGAPDLERMYQLFWTRVFWTDKKWSIILQPVAHRPDVAAEAYAHLVALVANDRQLMHDRRVRVLPQVHTLIWKGRRAV